MADENLTDEQQAEIVKKWFRENGLFLVGGLVLGIAGLFSWQSYQNATTITAEEASVAYEEMSRAVATQRYNKAAELHALIQDEYPGTPYADTAELALASALMKQNDAEGAAEVLERVAAGGSTDEVKIVARLRLGRVHLHLGDYEAAAKLANYAADDAYAPMFADLRGDIAYASGGELDVARTEYEAALAAGGPGFPQAGYVQVKLDALAVADAVAAADSEVAAE